MEGDDSEQNNPDGWAKGFPRPDRMWTERFVQPVKFRRFTGRGRGSKPMIFIQFDLPPGQDQLDPNVYAVLKELKYLDRSPEHGGGQCPTGLSSMSSARHKPGTLWALPDNPVGRTAADIVAARLFDLARQMEQEGKSGPRR